MFNVTFYDDKMNKKVNFIIVLISIVLGMFFFNGMSMINITMLYVCSG